MNTGADCTDPGGGNLKDTFSRNGEIHSADQGEGDKKEFSHPEQARNEAVYKGILPFSAPLSPPAPAGGHHFMILLEEWEFLQEPNLSEAP